MDINDPIASRDWADAWVAAHAPNKIRDDIDQFEIDHRARFRESYGRGIEQLYVEFGALVQAVDALNFVDRRHWPAHRPMQYVIVSKNLKAFHSAMDRLSAGFDVDAMSLVRGLYDAFLRIVHVSLHSTDPWGALVDKPPAPTPRFNATGIVQDQLRLDWLSNYSIMSVFAHGNVIEVLVALARMAQGTQPPERFGLVFESNETLTETVLPLLSLVMLLYLRFVVETLGAANDVDDSSLIATCAEAIGLLTVSMRSHPKPKWHSIANDVDYLFAVLTAADVGGDWKALRTARPLVDLKRSEP